MTGSDPEMMSFDRKLPGSGCRRPISEIWGMFELLQGCNSQEVALMCQQMMSATSHDRKWPGSEIIRLEVAWKWLWKAYKSSFGYI